MGLAVNPKKRLQSKYLRSTEAAENQALELTRAYPCPVCRQGRIEPIALTEAWGCNRCRQIFERRAESNTIGKLSTPHHRQRNWRWNGNQWVLGAQPVKSRASNAFTALTIGFLMWVLLSRLSLSAISSTFLLGIVVAVLLLVVMFWVLRQR